MAQSGAPAPAGKPSPRGGKACPSIAITPHAEYILEPSLNGTGHVTVEHEADGSMELCELVIESVGAANPEGDIVHGPTTQARTTCAQVSVSGLADDGGIRALATVGTPRAVALRLVRDDVEIANVHATPDYAPDECGFVMPHINVPLRR